MVEAAKDKAEKILRELEGVDQDTPQDELDEPADNPRRSVQTLFKDVLYCLCARNKSFSYLYKRL
nr:hypothetical protein [Escherichia coli]